MAEDPKAEVLPTGDVEVEEKIEYRDENGQLLDAAAVAKLRGAGVEFNTVYESRTRVVDADGNEILNEVVERPTEGAEGGGVAGTIAYAPEVETEAAGVTVSDAPAEVKVGGDLEKERVVEENLKAGGQGAVPEGREEL